MADFASAAYNLRHAEASEYVNINDISPYAAQAYQAVIDQKWTPLQFAALAPVLDRGAVRSGMLSSGFYINGNAATFVARSDDALVLSFRGTNDNGKNNPYDPKNTVEPDEDQWLEMVDHYSLFSPLRAAVDSYVADNGIDKVYVTGHSMGGAMALEYMSQRPGDKYQAVIFGASPFTKKNWLGATLRKDHGPDSRITQIEIVRDPVPMTFDLDIWFDGGTHPRPGQVISFGGIQTLDSPDRNPLGYYARNDNHSMDYYRQITDSVDADSWTKISAGVKTGTERRQTVLLGGRQLGDDFVVDGQRSGTNTHVDSGDDGLRSIDFKVIYGGKGNDVLTAGANNTLLLGGVGNDRLWGDSGSDTLDGGAGNDRLDGGTGNDTLKGGAGDDWLDGDLGNDTMRGGAGNDTYVVDHTWDMVTEASGEGIDIVHSTITTSLAAHVENLQLLGFAAINGTGNELANSLVGNSASNRLSGGLGHDTLNAGAGHDVLDGGAGNDRLAGGAGDDLYYIDAPGDVVTEASGESTDEIASTITTSLAAHVENVLLLGSAAINGVGNSLANRMVGNSANNGLSGGAGDDGLDGGDGNDSLNGGAGNDWLNGGVGVNWAQYVDAITGVTVNLALINAQNTGGAGIDTLLNIENLNGGAFNDTLTGNNGANVLHGGAGNDRVNGGDGNDSLNGGAGNDRLDGGVGVDWAQYVDAITGVTVNLALINAQNTGGAGIDTLLNIENLNGGAFNDTLTGNNGANVLLGGAGNDIVNGGDGNDRLMGGDGNDRLIGGAGRDSFLFNTAVSASNIDRLIDFVAADDTIQLENAIFSILTTTGVLNSAYLKIGTEAADSSDFIVYNPDIGALFYDADGGGAGVAAQIALLGTTTRPTLTSADFVVV